MGTVVVDGSGGSVVMDEVSNYYVFDFWVRAHLLKNGEGQKTFTSLLINTKDKITEINK